MNNFKTFYEGSDIPLMSDEEAKKTAEILGVRLNGHWEGTKYWTFTDYVSGSTFLGSNFEEAKHNYELMKKRFEDAKK